VPADFPPPPDLAHRKGATSWMHHLTQRCLLRVTAVSQLEALQETLMSSVSSVEFEYEYSNSGSTCIDSYSGSDAYTFTIADVDYLAICMAHGQAVDVHMYSRRKPIRDLEQSMHTHSRCFYGLAASLEC
jgi:hypothetical protein